MSTGLTRPRARVSATAGLLLLLAGCGSSGPAPQGTAAASGSASASAPAGTPVNVVEKEFSITLPAQTMKPGTYTFTIQNKGTFPHNLNVMGPGVDGQASETVSPGQTGTLTVTLKPGTYELWCSIDGHKSSGMDAKLTVA
jgi:uncharacterized cupredoxin-like copper-binding protein